MPQPLKDNKKYSFWILYGVDIETIEQLNYKYLGITALRLFSKEYQKLAKQIDQFENRFKKDLELFKYYHGEDISLILFSENEENLYMLYDLLIILIPSKINQWITFDTYFTKYKSKGTINKYHLVGSYSIWKSIHELYANIANEEVFYLTNNDVLIVNKIIKKYKSLSSREFYIKYLNLYRRAYHEEKDYFKYLLFFMTIESLIKDDESSGVVYKVRRLCAILIGSNSSESQLIFSNTKDAYNVRSKLVHSGQSELHKGKYLSFTHSLACEIGLTILLSQLNSDDIFFTTNKLGFGQKKIILQVPGLKSHGILTPNWLNFYLLKSSKKKK